MTTVGIGLHVFGKSAGTQDIATFHVEVKLSDS
jgi:hypothetical protein